MHILNEILKESQKNNTNINIHTNKLLPEGITHKIQKYLLELEQVLLMSKKIDDHFIS